MTTESIIAELEYIEKDNEFCHEKMKTCSKKQRAEYRKRILENNHQKMHLECTLHAIKYDPLF